MAHKTFLPKPLNQLLSEIRPTLSFGHLSLIFMNDASKLKSNYFSVSFYSNHLFSLGPCFIGTKESTDHLKIRKTICKKTRQNFNWFSKLVIHKTALRPGATLHWTSLLAVLLFCSTNLFLMERKTGLNNITHICTVL